MPQERYHVENMRRAYQAGVDAKAKGQERTSPSGWSYPKGKYYGWFLMGYNGEPFVDFYDPYASKKADILLDNEYKKHGRYLNDLDIARLTLARYISSRE